MGRIFVYRNGYIEVVGKGDTGYIMSYYRNINNKLTRTYKSSYHNALTKFKKVIDTEGF